MDAMALGLAEYLRDLAGKVERGDLCNGEVWERLYQDGPEPVEYTAGPTRNGATGEDP